MNYEDYLHTQAVTSGHVKKPLKYRKGERRAIDELLEKMPRRLKILDVGCGTGTGIKHMLAKGFENVQGIEINKRKIEMATRRGLDVTYGEVENFRRLEMFEVFWVSHVFEHMYDAQKALANLIAHAKKNAQFFFILPYPDTAPSAVHCSGEVLGLRANDEGKSTRRWFTNNGLRVTHQWFDNFREPEIWLHCVLGEFL